MTANAKTDAVLLTPAGRGAVASLAVTGPDAAQIVDRCFAAASGRPIAESPRGAIVFGRWTRPPAEGEELVVVRRDDASLELHCHGGAAVSQAILDSLAESGCRCREWREWSAERAADRIEAEARAALAEATTLRAAAVLLDQLRGALRREVDSLEKMIAGGESSSAAQQLATLLRRGRLGLHLARPWSVVLAGRPNVGKSSLINALLGYGRALVFDQPGTTRDVLTAAAAFDGWAVELSDTAGLREARTATDQQPSIEAQQSIEALGIERARARIAAADLVVFVAALDEPWTAEDQAILSLAGDALVVYNKSDLVRGVTEDGRPPGLPVSAMTGEGVERLADAIAQRLVPDPPPPGAAVPFTPRQVQFLEGALSALEHGNTAAALAQLQAL